MPAKPAAKKIAHESQADFSQAFAALKKILVPYVGRICGLCMTRPQHRSRWSRGCMDLPAAAFRRSFPRNRWN
jgi:hypothetical protein